MAELRDGRSLRTVSWLASSGAVSAIGSHYRLGATGLGFTVSSALLGAGLGLVYGIYAAFALLSLVFVSAVITETKGHELEDMPAGINLPVPRRPQRGRREVLANEPGRL